MGCSKVAGIDRYGTAIITNLDKFQVLQNAIEVDKYTYSPEKRREIRVELGYLPEELVIGHVGRMTYEKNHDFILQIFKCICSMKDKVRLILVGDGKLRDELESKAEKLGLSEKISFLGIRADVNKVMQAMDIFVFPSLFEGLPVTMVEAQAAGLPCVISNRVPNECIITDGLVTIKNLSESPEEWAKHILSKQGIPQLIEVKR